MSKVLVTGGAGYVGAVLVPRLVRAGHQVRVIDWFLFGRDVLSELHGHPGLEEWPGDIRDLELLRRALAGCDAVIHLACVSNDASFALDPALGRAVNYECFVPLVEAARAAGVRRFIYASTSSVYGVSDAPRVTEDHPLLPLTDYNRYKGLCEPLLLERASADFVPVVVRPATVCGCSPRQRLDLTVNILAAQAYHQGRLTVFGGDQMRPNIHIDDITRLYEWLLGLPDERVAGRTWNAGYQNLRVRQIAELVRDVVAEELPDRPPIEIVTTPSDDLRSYHIDSEMIARDLGFRPRRTVEDAVRELLRAFADGRVPGALTEDRYHNVRWMRGRELELLGAKRP